MQEKREWAGTAKQFKEHRKTEIVTGNYLDKMGKSKGAIVPEYKER
ncbi:hypothetical protein KDA_06210 [Dictyobacter alpinus]|uniref:Uncharacterized protein n=1 Tax=Dictyobacter alpinus TaxID=2014873 RepID=A0A402B1F2_9CHLR|nr:hypothetical protein KDA_06210 [Dictyobacter alpinus]